MKEQSRAEQSRAEQSRAALPGLTRKIYAHLADDISRKIYEERLRYTFTDDIASVRRMIDLMEFSFSPVDGLKDKPGPFMIYGAGQRGRQFARLYPEIAWKCFIDKNKAGQQVDGLEVVSLSEAARQAAKAKVLISNLAHNENIIRDLLQKGFKFENIYSTREMEDRLIASQYFDLSALPHDSQEVFVDGGSFDGFTVHQFLHWSGAAGYKKIYAFEPNKTSYESWSEKLKDVRNLSLIKKGLYSEETYLDFYDTGDSNAFLGNTHEHENLKDGLEAVRIPVTTIDKSCKELPTFIKLDLEGAEYDALRGAEQTIREGKPKLAISIYHKPEDIWELPELLLQYQPGYKFYLRHYSLHAAETVLYAV